MENIMNLAANGSIEFLESDFTEQSGEIPIEDLGQDWIPECMKEKTPFCSQVFPTIDSAFEFYKEYGRTCGFDVRRSSKKKFKSGPRVGQTRRKHFLCSKAGPALNNSNELLESEESVMDSSRRTVTSRNNCPAKLVVLALKNKGYEVRTFTKNHNHCFAGKGGMQFLRCSRSLTDFHKRFIVDAAKSNIGATRAHAIFKSMIGSYENVGATVVDFKNFSRDIKDYIGKHDADMIIQKLKDIQESSDPALRFEYKTDSENHLTQLLWADGVGRRNYEVFGDAVSFDATYRTNKYGMVFIPFIGIDNHWKSVTFASALLEKEDTENYTWLCEAFKKVFGTLPKCIITDQDPTMKIAIQKSFPGVKHHLCMWHIMKKFPAKLGTLFCAESPFMKKLNEFVWSEHATTSEFESGWNEVVSEFGLTDNVWLKDMYDLRHSWIPAYFNNDPMVGLLRTTSRSESSNFYFNHFVQKGDTLSEFYLCYQSAIEKQRNCSARLNHYDDVIPRTMTNKKLEKDAAENYTRAMFYRVQEEIIYGCGDIEIERLSVHDNIKKITVKDPRNKNRTFEVALHLETQDIECSCNLYTRVGYLCNHCFFCLGISGISQTPKKYVNNRWLKRAEERFSTLELGEIFDQNSKEDRNRSKTMDCWFNFQGCISDASGNEDFIDYVNEGLLAMRNHIKESKKQGKSTLDELTIEELIGSKAVEEVTIENPNQSNNKGSRKRIAGAVEKNSGTNKRQKRKCKGCFNMEFHDIRNCPVKKNQDLLAKNTSML